MKKEMEHVKEGDHDETSSSPPTVSMDDRRKPSQLARQPKKLEVRNDLINTKCCQ